MFKRLAAHATIPWALVFAASLPGIAAETDMKANTGKQTGEAEIRVRHFLPAMPLSRAQRPAEIGAVIENMGDARIEVTPRLILPEGVRIVGSEVHTKVSISASGETALSWQIEANEAGQYELRLEAGLEGATAAVASLPMLFLPPVEQRTLPYIPEPKPVHKRLLVGAHHCPLWEADKIGMWTQVLKHPERTPALGFYAQENPEVSDWETKWAVEHGIDFFIYCWYRASQGGPVEMRFGSAIHDALFKSRFVDKMKFTIMWENQSRGVAGVADEQDLMENLLPFWIENYFTHPSYLKVDNKPVLFIYRPEFLIQDLGSEENVAKAFE